MFLCEGVFDAARLTFLGRTAIAACCNNPQPDLKNWLDCLARPVVVVCDSDAAGRELAAFGHYVEVVADAKDLGDSSSSFVKYLVDKYR